MKDQVARKLRIGINTWLSDGMRLEEIIKRVSQLGFDGVEIAGYPEIFSPERRAWLRKLLRENELEVVSVSAGVPFYRNPEKLNLHASNREVRRTSVQYVRNCLDLASYLEGELVYVCSVSKDSRRERTALENFSESLSACAQYAEAAALRVALEPFPDGQISATEDAVNLVSKLGFRNLGLLLDTGHLLLERESLHGAVELAKRVLMHVHINNNDGSRDAHWPPQKGSLTSQDFAGFISSLRNAGYNRYISAELSNIRAIDATLADTMKFLSNLKC